MVRLCGLAPSVTLQNALWEALQEGQGCAGEGSLSVGALGDLQGNASMDSQQSACEDSFGRVCVSGHGLGLESGTSSACEDSPLDIEGESAYLNREHLNGICCLKGQNAARFSAVRLRPGVAEVNEIGCLKGQNSARFSAVRFRPWVGEVSELRCLERGNSARFSEDCQK